ncbi:MAG TPA: hypothetical protein VGP93_20390, partial [Polyangiaceae bacterium]|nr:hypothetical protein [Polyangiaceae bacterium]
MKNDDQDRADPDVRAPSVPPPSVPPASVAPPSAPPSTDEIDSDWGGDSEEQAAPAPPPPPPAATAESSPPASVPPQPTPQVRSAKHSGTLIGLVAPVVERPDVTPKAEVEGPEPALEPAPAATETAPRSEPKALPAATPSQTNYDAAPSSTGGTETNAEPYDAVVRPPPRGGLGPLVLIAAAVACGIVGFWFVVGPGRETTRRQAAAAKAQPAPRPHPKPPSARAAQLQQQSESARLPAATEHAPSPAKSEQRSADGA